MFGRWYGAWLFGEKVCCWYDALSALVRYLVGRCYGGG